MVDLSRFQIPPPSHWQEFESICCDLWREIWKDPNAVLHGRRGQAQQGVDAYGQPDKGRKWAAVQCKGKDNYSEKTLTEEDVTKEVDNAKKFSPKLSEFIIATSGQRDASIQKLVREISQKNLNDGLFSVHVWFWDDIIGKMGEFPNVIEKHIPKEIIEVRSSETKGKNCEDKSFHSPRDLKYNFPEKIQTEKGDLLSSNEIIHEKSNKYNIFEINSDLLKWKDIPSEILSYESGTISIWVEVKEEHLTKGMVNKGRFIISHSTSKQKNEFGFYPNTFSLKRNETAERVFWEFVWSDNKKRNTIPSEPSLNIKADWHLFSISWSKRRNSVKFYINGKPQNGEKTQDNWPYADNTGIIFIGRWIRPNKKSYFNSRIGPYIIYNKAITIEEIDRFYQLLKQILSKSLINIPIIHKQNDFPEMVEIKHGMKESFLINILMKKLTLKARINLHREAGNAHLLIIRVNNILLNRCYIMNKSEMKRFPKKPEGEAWFDREIKAWHLCYSPDFQSNYRDKNYAVIDDDPYEFEFDLSVIKPDDNNQYLIEFEHSGLTGGNAYRNPVVIRDIKVEGF